MAQRRQKFFAVTPLRLRQHPPALSVTADAWNFLDGPAVDDTKKAAELSVAEAGYRPQVTATLRQRRG